MVTQLGEPNLPTQSNGHVLLAVSCQCSQGTPSRVQWISRRIDIVRVPFTVDNDVYGRCCCHPRFVGRQNGCRMIDCSFAISSFADGYETVPSQVTNLVETKWTNSSDHLLTGIDIAFGATRSVFLGFSKVLQ